MPRHDKDSSWQRACDFSELKNHKHWKLCRLYIAFAVVKLFGNLGDRNNYQSWFTCWTSFWDLKILEKRFYYNSDRKFWIVSTIGDFAKLQSWMTVQHVLGALLKLSWKAYYNEKYPKKTIFANKMSTSDAFDQYYWRFIWFPLLAGFGKSTNKQLYCFSY